MSDFIYLLDTTPFLSSPLSIKNPWKNWLCLMSPKLFTVSGLTNLYQHGFTETVLVKFIICHIIHPTHFTYFPHFIPAPQSVLLSHLSTSPHPVMIGKFQDSVLLPTFFSFFTLSPGDLILPLGFKYHLYVYFPQLLIVSLSLSSDFWNFISQNMLSIEIWGYN